MWLDGTLHAIDPDAQISYDPAAPENTLVTERAPAQDFCRFLGWD